MIKNKCDCYFEQIVARYNTGRETHCIEGRCRGTKEIEVCSCMGDTKKCNFYEHKRTREAGYKDSAKELRPCPFCGGSAKIILCDDEGNHRPDEYELDPYSGIGFVLYHGESENQDCPIANEDGLNCGRFIYESREEAVRAWNGEQQRSATED